MPMPKVSASGTSGRRIGMREGAVMGARYGRGRQEGSHDYRAEGADRSA